MNDIQIIADDFGKCGICGKTVPMRELSIENKLCIVEACNECSKKYYVGVKI